MNAIQNEVLEGPVLSQNVPALPGQFSETGYQLPDKLEYEEWEKIGQALQETEYQASRGLTMLRWWIGDWLAYGEHRYGEKYAQAVEILDHRYSEASLKTFMFVSGHVEKLTRVNSLSWKHHQQVAALEPDGQTEILALAQENNWSVRDTREEVNRRKGKNQSSRPGKNGKQRKGKIVELPKGYSLKDVEDYSFRRIGKTWTDKDHYTLLGFLGVRI